MAISQTVMTDVTAALREIGYSPADAARVCRQHYSLVRWFQDEATADEIANIIDQNVRGALEVEAN